MKAKHIPLLIAVATVAAAAWYFVTHTKKNRRTNTATTNTSTSTAPADNPIAQTPTTNANAWRKVTPIVDAWLKEYQNAAYLSGNSKLQFPSSKHNASPSNAVDIAPYPIDWNDLSRFQQMGEIAKQKAAMLGISIKWGGDWIGFKDYPHIELA